jgi:hypothetical protein
MGETRWRSIQADLGNGRKGTQGAEPRFGIRSDSDLGGVMRKASEISVEDHPDARLIAAAPDLLEALKASYATFYDKDCELGKQVAAAIAKAEAPCVS